MIRLSRLADYAVILMSHLAGSPAHIHNAHDVAAETGLPAPTVSKILGLMSRAELLVSHRGQGGGFSLSRAPSAISVADIVGVVDGPVALTTCIEEGPGECSREPTCRVRGYWQKINEAMKRALSEVTLADLACPVLTFPMTGSIDLLSRRPAASGAGGDAQIQDNVEH
ncbi:MAG: SUF system Fe-S cluster assembly regulator [Sphingomonadales bacterium]